MGKREAKTFQPQDLPKRRCKATKRSTGERCKNAPIRGGTVCRFHGGAAPQVRAKAEEQLRLARDELMSLLLGIARDTAQSANDRLKAITWALERAGFKTGMKVELEMPPWQKTLKEMWEGADDEDDTKAPALPPVPPKAITAHEHTEHEQKLARLLDEDHRKSVRPLSGEVLLPAVRPHAGGTRISQGRLRR